MDKYNMTGHKLLWHLDRLEEYASGKSVAPLNIQLGITNGCNYDCIYCYGLAVMGKVGVAGRTDMPIASIKRFLSDAKDVGVRSISLVGEGENTVHPDFYDVINHSKNIGLDMGIATNGIPLDPERIGEVLDAMTWLRFSCGGGTKDVYELVHGRKTFNKFLNIVSKAVEYKKRNGSKTTIGLQMVVMRENMYDIVNLARLGKDLGVDYLVAKPCSDTPEKTLHVPHDQYKNLEDQFLLAEGFGTDDYAVVMKREKFGNAGINDFDCCRATNFVIQISAKGNVAPCGHLLGYRADEFNLGNIVEQSFKDIVNSERYGKVQKKVQSLNVKTECETNCLHYYMNHFLQGINEPPDHINFV